METQEKLVQAATLLFAQGGFDGTSVKEVAEAAGVNVSLVSYHFGGKEGLYHACLEAFGKERLAMAEELLQPARSAEEFRVRLGLFVEEIWRCHIEQPETCALIHREHGNEFAKSENIFRATFLKLFETLVSFFRSAQEASFLKRDLDPMLTASLFFGSVIHLAQGDRVSEKFLSLSLRDSAFRKRMLEHLLQCFLKGAAS